MLPKEAYPFLPYAICFNITVYWKKREAESLLMPNAEEAMYIFCDETRDYSYILYKSEEEARTVHGVPLTIKQFEEEMRTVKKSAEPSATASDRAAEKREKPNDSI